MQWILSRVLLLSWALWFGGLVAVFLAVSTIFATLHPDRAQAGVIAAGVFGRFEKLMLASAVAAMLSVAGMMVRGLGGGGSHARTAMLVLLMVGAAGAMVSNLVISPKINALRVAKETQSPEFKKLHGMSMGVYVTVTGVVGAAGLLIPAVIRRQRNETLSGGGVNA